VIKACTADGGAILGDIIWATTDSVQAARRTG
jgi:hypothetical protein